MERCPVHPTWPKEFDSHSQRAGIESIQHCYHAVYIPMQPKVSLHIPMKCYVAQNIPAYLCKSCIPIKAVWRGLSCNHPWAQHFLWYARPSPVVTAVVIFCGTANTRGHGIPRTPKRTIIWKTYQILAFSGPRGFLTTVQCMRRVLGGLRVSSCSIWGGEGGWSKSWLFSCAC